MNYFDLLEKETSIQGWLHQKFPNNYDDVKQDLYILMLKYTGVTTFQEFKSIFTGISARQSSKKNPSNLSNKYLINRDYDINDLIEVNDKKSSLQKTYQHDLIRISNLYEEIDYELFPEKEIRDYDLITFIINRILKFDDGFIFRKKVYNNLNLKQVHNSYYSDIPITRIYKSYQNSKKIINLIYKYDTITNEDVVFLYKYLSNTINLSLEDKLNPPIEYYKQIIESKIKEYGKDNN